LDTVEIGQVHATVPLMRHLWDYGQNLLSILRVFVPILDILLVLLLIYAMLVVIGERRTLWMVRGFILLLLAASLSQQAGLVLLAFVLDKLVVGAAVAMAFILQGEFRRLLERLGRGQVLQLLTITQREPPPHPDSVLDELVDAIKELSQNRIGALIILETGQPINERAFSVPGVRINAEVSKELLQTIFQTSTLLHDGAVLVRGARVLAAGVILPISERLASRQLGTRHRAAMGITERVDHCVCVVVSEETGSISLAERGTLNRPLTSSKLRELLHARLSGGGDRDAVTPQLWSFGKRLPGQLLALVQRLLSMPSSASREKR
jgi:uncharacterized protein (TIGR00159 family)